MHVGNEENVRQIMQHRVHMAGSDAILHGNVLHPRAYGTFSRYLGEFSDKSFSPIHYLRFDMLIIN
jgi:N-acyl-D-amino-acid deacylase